MNWCCQPLSSHRRTSRGWPWHWASRPQRPGGDSTPRNWWRGRGVMFLTQGQGQGWNLCGMWQESYLNNEELEEACVEFEDRGGFCGAENRSGIWNWSIIIHYLYILTLLLDGAIEFWTWNLVLFLLTFSRMKTRKLACRIPEPPLSRCECGYIHEVRLTLG